MQPYSFQIEPVEGCTRRCDFCGINQLDLRKPNFMSLEMAKTIALQIHEDFEPKKRIEFALHGEPLLHPNIVEIIRIFRKHNPQNQLSIISNGNMLIRKKNWEVSNLFEAGLNYLMIDFYDEREKWNQAVMHSLEDINIVIKDMYKDNINIWRFRGADIQTIVIVSNLAKKTGEKVTRIVHTAGGNLPENVYNKYGIDRSKFPVLSRCSKPFRELSINYDGNVSLCCEDWCRQQVIGNVNNQKLIAIWDSELMHQCRYLLYHKRRDLIEICSKCDERSFRTGLLKIEREYPNLIKTSVKNERRSLF